MFEDIGIDLGSLFWIFVVFSMLQPVVAQRLLTSRRYRAIRDFERSRGSRVIVMVHRQETMGFLGFPLVRYIDIEDSEAVLRAIRLTDDACPLDLVLHTPGGLVLATAQIAEALRSHPAKVTVFVPHYAMSGGTLLALAADQIVMDPTAVLGPVDPQLGEYAAASLVALVEAKPVADIDDATWLKADVGRKALAQVEGTVKRLLDGREPEVIETVLAELARGATTHDHPFRADEIAKMGLDVSTDFPVALHQLMALHPQPTGRRASVQYIPEPYRPSSDG